MERTARGEVTRVLTIAGSDSGGGAGIQADLKTFAAFGVYGTSCLTAVTAQNTLGVQGVAEIPLDVIRLQLESVLSDLGTHAVKTGMLANAAVIETVADVLQAYRIGPFVVDPVMIAKGGQPLLESSAVETLKMTLLPLATVVTPNLPEAECLCGHSITSVDDCRRAAERLLAMGVGVVVIKGGHAAWEMPIEHPDDRADDVVDFVFDGEQMTSLRSPRTPGTNTHGTGCTFSAAITASLALGMPLLDAIATAKSFVSDAVAEAADWNVGHGHGPTDHSVAVRGVSGLVLGRSYRRIDGNWIAYEK